jgi:hypothetical protein
MSLWRKRQLNTGKKMKREDIIRMAREAGWQEDMFGIGIWDSKELNVFAALVAAAEREACAEVCESDDWNVAAAMIRARKNK